VGAVHVDDALARDALGQRGTGGEYGRLGHVHVVACATVACSAFQQRALSSIYVGGCGRAARARVQESWFKR
jgi:hypothetical protein